LLGALFHNQTDAPDTQSASSPVDEQRVVLRNVNYKVWPTVKEVSTYRSNCRIAEQDASLLGAFTEHNQLARPERHATKSKRA
jgi:hypothetical protein